MFHFYLHLIPDQHSQLEQKQAEQFKNHMDSFYAKPPKPSAASLTSQLDDLLKDNFIVGEFHHQTASK